MEKRQVDILCLCLSSEIWGQMSRTSNIKLRSPVSTCWIFTRSIFLSLLLLETLNGRPWTERIIDFLSIRRGERG